MSNAASNGNGKPKPCGAKSKGTGKPCPRPGTGAGGRCRYHGGASPTGIASPHFKHGRYAKHLGPKWEEAYVNSLNDSEGLLDLTETLAVLDVNVQRAAERTKQKDTPLFRENACELYDKARAAESSEESARLLTELGKLLHRGASEDGAFRTLANAATQLSKRAEAAWKVRLSAATAINAADLTGVLAKLVSVLREEIHDRGVREQVLRRVTSEVMAGGPGPSGSRDLPGSNGSNGAVAD
jgi:hypothetical protein